MNYTYLTPRSTAQVLRNNPHLCLNMGLILGRYAPYEVIEPTDRLNDRGRAIGKERNFWLEEVCKRLNAAQETELVESIAATQDRWGAMTANAQRFQREAASRMIVGLGGKGALEFGLTVHPVTGLPYIPGSALKGLCRNYALLLIASQLKRDIESEALEKLDEEIINGEVDLPDAHDYYRPIFGSQGSAGECVFYDAVLTDLPENGSIFCVEVMTPHFRTYYESQGDRPPHDADDPNPVTYLAVCAGTRFGFAIGNRHNLAPDAEQKLAKKARDWLRTALDEMGIGAKTAAGYGVFKKANT